MHHVPPSLNANLPLHLSHLCPPFTFHFPIRLYGCGTGICSLLPPVILMFPSTWCTLSQVDKHSPTNLPSHTLTLPPHASQRNGYTLSRCFLLLQLLPTSFSITPSHPHSAHPSPSHPLHW